MTANKLQQLMNELVTAYRELLAQVDRKRRVLLEHHVDELPQCYQAELRVLEQIVKIQSEWRSAVHDLFGMHVQDAGDSLDFRSVIAQISSEAARNELLAYEKQLIDLHDEIKRRNKQNQQLAAQQLEYIDHMMELYHDPVDQDFTYGHPAGHRQAPTGVTMKRFESRA